MTTNKEEMEKLKLSMLEAETAGQLSALIIDFTHEEIMQVYSELVLEQQARIQAIWKKAWLNS